MFENELRLKSFNNLNEINNEKYNIAVYKNYCDPFIFYDELNFNYLWINKKENHFEINNKKLASLINETALIFQTLTNKNFKIEIDKATKPNSCVLFHEDNVDLRLLITLCGEGGTQYIANSNINLEHLYKHWQCPDEQNSKLIKNFNEIKIANVGDLLILKGKKSNSKSIFHRSFPLSSDIDCRYILKMTTVENE